MSTPRTLLALLACAALVAGAARSGLLEPGTPPPATTTTTRTQDTVDPDGENGTAPRHTRPPARALTPAPRLTRRQLQRLKARRIYIAAPITLGPVTITARGDRTALLITHTAVPASTARTALTAARYAYRDTSTYTVTLHQRDPAPGPRSGPVAQAAGRAVRQSVAIPPGPGRTAINLPSVTATHCTSRAHRHRCTVTTIEFLATRTGTLNAHRRTYHVTVTTPGTRPPKVTAITTGQ